MNLTFKRRVKGFKDPLWYKLEFFNLILYKVPKVQKFQLTLNTFIHSIYYTDLLYDAAMQADGFASLCIFIPT